MHYSSPTLLIAKKTSLSRKGLFSLIVDCLGMLCDSAMHKSHCLVIVVLTVAAFSRASAQSAFISCEENYIPPLINVDFPDIGQGLDSDVTIITYPFIPPASNPHQLNPIAGTHSVLVYDPDHFLNRAIFYFNVNQDGTIQGAPPTSTTKDAKGNIASYSTVIGTYFFPGDNFPFTADSLTHQFPPVIDHRQYWLDSLPFDNPPPQIVRYETITSTFSYVQWARWVSWLAFAEGPYDPNSAPITPSHVPVVFNLQDMPVPNSPGCQNGCATCSGSSPMLATAALNRFDAGVVITDTPISYTPSLGGGMGFTVSYKQRHSDPATFTYSNLGAQWQAGWISYISGGPTNNQGQATYNAPDGTKYLYDGYEQTVVSGDAPGVVAEGDFQGNQAFSHGTLHYRQGPERYEQWLPDGTVQVFARPINTASGRQFFLTSVTDPQGNVTTLNYNFAAATNGTAVLTSVTDPKGGQLLFSYDNSDPLKITKVTRSCDGLSAKFGYTNGQLTSITDPGGLTSSYHYTSGTNFIDAMTTPYGKTTFSSTDGNGFYEADMTNPLGQTERVEYQSNLDTSLYAASESSAPSADGLSINNANLNKNNTFYWNRRAMADAAAGGIAIDSAAFYAMARVTHWATSSAGTIPVALSSKNPLEGRVWNNYPGQQGDYLDPIGAGTSSSPSATARLLDGGATQVSYASYNGDGMITQSVDPLGRTTNYDYGSNGIDPLTVTQANGSGQDTLSIMTYNGQHEPLTITDASGQTTTMTYNDQGQILTRTDPKSEITTLGYDGNGYLSTVTGPLTGATTTYTYDSAGRVKTMTDSEGYTVTNGYDNLDRPTSTSYPDGTSDQTVYKILDVWKTIDRQNRTTWNQYDAIRELLQSTDPQGRTTKYSWCTCGGLSTLTDANNNVTTWNLDLQGRVTGKSYADGSRISYAYEINTSRLHSMTDALGNVALYGYNVDNTLASTTYTPASGVSSTPNVSFSYDPVYNRVTGMSDGTGATSYTYNAITGSTTTGAGRLASVSAPVCSTGDSATVAYSYDELGRVTGRTVDGGSTLSTTFDSMGRVTGVNNPLGAFTYAYVDTTSRLSSVTYPSGTSLTTSYSYFGNTSDQRLQTIQNLKGSTELSKFDYTYNAVGTIATWTQQADSSTAVVNTLSYDNADQLTSDVQSGGASASNAYHYDPAGNRLAEVTGTGTTTGQFNNVNQLTALSTSATGQTVSGYTSAAVTNLTVNAVPATITGGTNFTANVPLGGGTNSVSVVAHQSGTAPTTHRYQVVTSGSSSASLAYDANGNTLTDENGNSYQWDALNRLTRITYPSGASSLFAYDGLSRRVQIVEKDGSGTVTSTKNYLWIGSEMAEERDGSNTVTKRYFPQGEQQVVSGTATLYYYTRDHLGSVREMLNSAGSIVARYGYDPYGKTTLVSGTDLATFGYTGIYKHQASGLEFAMFRVFDSSTERWINRDPIQESGGVNLYEYCGDDPEDHTDAFGLFSPSHPYCRALAKKIRNIQDDIFKRNIDIYNDPQNLPWRAPNDWLVNKGNPASSIFGHYAIIDKLKADLAMNIALYAAKCNDPEDPPGGTPECQPCRKVAVVVAVTAGGVTTYYIAYRCIRMVPSLTPWTWPTIPENLAIP